MQSPPSMPMIPGFGAGINLQTATMTPTNRNQSNTNFGGNASWTGGNANSTSLMNNMGSNQVVMETAYSVAKREALEKSQQSGKGNILLEKSSALDLLAQLDSNKPRPGTVSPSGSDSQLLKSASPSSTDPIQALPNLTVPLESIKPGKISYCRHNIFSVHTVTTND